MATYTINVPSNFHFEGTIRSYGFFLLAPNFYDRENKIFSRPLEVDGKIVNVDITCGRSTNNAIKTLTVKCNRNVSSHERNELTKQISRMLRIDASYVDDFHGKFPTAKEVGYGRLFRSPNLYEDIVKTMTNVNTTFSRTQSMNVLLCKHYGIDGAFPSASTLAKVSPEDMKEKCLVGYRAGRIVDFAKQVSDRKIDLSAIEALAEKYLHYKQTPNKQNDAFPVLEALKKRLLSIHGFGEFSANNILQLLGIFDIIPSDSETARHLREHHKITLKNPKEIHNEAQKLYAKYEPFQFLVYWYNLYEFSQRVEFPFAPSPPTSVYSTSTPPSFPSPVTISTSTTVSSTAVTKITRKRKEDNKDKKEKRKRGQKRNDVDEPDTIPEESPRRSKRLSLQKS